MLSISSSPWQDTKLGPIQQKGTSLDVGNQALLTRTNRISYELVSSASDDPEDALHLGVRRDPWFYSCLFPSYIISLKLETC